MDDIFLYLRSFVFSLSIKMYIPSFGLEFQVVCPEIGIACMINFPPIPV